MILPLYSEEFVLTIASWKKILRDTFTKWEKLAEFLELSPDQKSVISEKMRFPLQLPFRLAEKIEKGTLDDPILRQFLPLSSEKEAHDGFVADPVGHIGCRKEAKLVHKYHGRALLRCTSACAMHCRYCYMQHFPYDCEDKTFEKELKLLWQDSSIKEVILSGGDPLSLDDRILKNLIDQLSEIPHVKHIRIHSRFPIGIPERIDEDFLSIFDGLKQSLWFVIHCNHARELDEEVLHHLSLLRKRGFNLLNQSVLLKEVNDDVNTLEQLSLRLIENNIIPYYLHQLDRVQGAAHFEVSEEKGCELVQQLRVLLPGYAVPAYVREIPGKPYKVLLNKG